MFDNLETRRSDAEVLYKRIQFFLDLLNKITGQTFKITLEGPDRSNETAKPVREANKRKSND